MLLLNSMIVLTFIVQLGHSESALQASGSKTWTVDDDGPADFRTIQGAINAANDGDTVFVRRGVYYEHVNVNKTLLVIAEIRNSSIIDAGYSGTAVNVTANGVWIDDLAIRNAAQSAVSVFGDNDRISGVGIYSNTSSGFPEQQIGIEVHSSGNIIEKCEIFDSYNAGIVITVNTGAEKNTSNNVVTGNEIAYGGDGVVLLGRQITDSPSVYNNRIIGNIIHNNSSNSAGIHLYMTYRNNIAYNTLQENGEGILLEYSPSIQGFQGNTVHHNNFVNNAHNALVTTLSLNNSLDDGSEGNYWSDYSGVDANRDGIGDSPYICDESNRDNYPLIRPIIQGDANRDGIVNIKDASLVGSSWLSRRGESRYNSHVDFNMDGTINIKDIAIISVNWQKHL